MKLVLTFLLVISCISSLYANAAIVNLVNNGGFESGSFDSWIVLNSNGNTGNCDNGFTVGSSGTATGCTGYAPFNQFVMPQSGGFAAYNSFDGNGPQTFTLQQNFTFSISSPIIKADLNWWDAVAFGSGYTFSQPRTFSVDLTIDGIVNNLFTQSFQMTGQGLFQNWELTSIDLTNLINSLSNGTHSATLAFKNYIPQSFSGPGSFGLDNVSLVLDSTPRQAVPEPVSIALLCLGFIGIAVSQKRRTKNT